MKNQRMENVNLSLGSLDNRINVTIDLSSPTALASESDSAIPDI